MIKENKRINKKDRKGIIANRIVIKIGSSSITKNKKSLNVAFMHKIADQVAVLFRFGVEIVIVSSGAVVCGKGLTQSLKEDVVHDQVAAIYGQNHLMSKWGKVFKKHRILTGQVLLSENDLKNPNTPVVMGMKHGIQIINANDAVNDEEMKAYFLSADNDRLAGHIAQFINADTLLLLTDVDGVMDHKNSVIKELRTGMLVELRGKSKVGTGGMESKIKAGFKAAKDGIRVIIANAHEDDVILKAARGESIGTLLVR